MSWQWETDTSNWQVDLDRAKGVLHWSGEDKPRQGVPEYALAGGGVDQTFDELLLTGVPGYGCPPAILAEVIAAVRTSRAPSKANVAAGDVPDEGILALVDSALRTVSTHLSDARVKVSEDMRDIPDDRPDQTAGYERTTVWRVTERAEVTLVREWTPWGGLRVEAHVRVAHADASLAYRDDAWEVSGLPALVDALAKSLTVR